MSAVTLRSDSAAAPVRGRAEIVFATRGEETRLASLFQHDPLRVLFPSPPPGDLLTAALVTTSGGLVGGDELTIRVAAGAGARAQVSSQAAEKIYRSAGDDCRIDMTLDAGPESWLEWLPQETIVFDGARFRRRTVIDAAPGARVLAGEILVFGRTAMGETLRSGLVRDAWEVRRDERLVWADALHLDGDLAGPLVHPAGLDSATATATAVYVGDDGPGLLEPVRDLLDDCDAGVRAAASVINDILVVRWIAAEALALRRAFGGFWAAFRQRAAGLPDRLPRLWYI